MRAAILCLLLVSCTPTIERVERHDASVTDSALSVLDRLAPTVDTISIVKTQTIEKIRYIESSPRVLAMVRPMPIEKMRCDTVWIRDTVWISR
jgi:pantothenate synthetase